MSKKIHIVMSYILLVVVLFTAFPKVYIHKLMGHNHVSEQAISNGFENMFTKNNTTQNCNLEKFETPVNFTILKIVLSCTPFIQFKEKTFFLETENSPTKNSFSFSFLRGPPQA